MYKYLINIFKFTEIIIITLESLKFPIEEAIFDLNLSVKYIIVEDDPTIGTLQSISLLQHHIKVSQFDL